MSSHSKDTDDLQCSKLEISSENEGEIECAVCLLTAVHPVRLPCTHIFCYLCVKGIANRSKKCALCRQEISPQFLLKPNLLKSEDLDKDTSFEDGYQWYYEGNRGWWQYDERTSQELESNFKENKEKKLEMLIAGFLYIIDFEGMVQFRRNDPNRRRKIKRDLISIPKKGIAGLRVKKPEVTVPERMVGDGNDSEDISSTNQISSNAMSSQVQNNNPDNNNQSLSSSSSINNEPQGDNTDDRLNRNDSSYPSSINNVGNRTETLQYVQVVDVHDDSTTATVATQSINNSGVQTESDSSAAEDAIQSTMANLRLNEDANVTTSSSENATGLWKL